jgi:hypothetical protein
MVEAIGAGVKYPQEEDWDKKCQWGVFDNWEIEYGS